jgi:type IV pilus assembly protein PilW
MSAAPALHRRQRGVSLVELMVSLVIGLLLVIAMSALFVNSSALRREVELSAEVIENGRYGLDVLGRELSQAGYYGPLTLPSGSTVAPCSTALADWTDSLAIPAIGANNAAAGMPCIARKPDSDAVFVQRASTCTVGEAGCEAELADAAYLQVSECGSEYSSHAFVVGAGGDAAAFTLQTKACDGTHAAKRRLVRRIFYVSPANVLSYVDVTLAGASAPVALVDNIEQLQLEYALDDNGDGTPDQFSSTPADWTRVIGARVWLLARSGAASTNTRNAMDFQLGDLPATSVTVAASGANPKRRVYSTYVPFVTPKLRRES